MSNTQSSKNALTHGFYASDVVLAGESQQEFDDLLQAYRDEYYPDGASHEAAVFDRDAAKSQTEAAQRVCESLGKQAEQICKPDETNVDSQVVEFEKLTVSLKEFNLVFEDLVSSLRRVEEQKLDQIEQAYRPHIMEKELKIQAEVDRRIEKVLKRLVIINEYKKQYRPKSVNAIQIEATKLPPKSSDESDGI